MATKQPVLRPAYRSDAKYLRRLALAVEQDGATSNMNWRMRVCGLLREVAAEFEEVEIGRPEKT